MDYHREHGLEVRNNASSCDLPITPIRSWVRLQCSLGLTSCCPDTQSASAGRCAVAK